MSLRGVSSSGSGRGTVFLREFDEGMKRATGAKRFPVRETSGGAVVEAWFLVVQGVAPAHDGDPGVRVIFAAPEETTVDYVYPCIVVRRGDVVPAMDRWHPGAESYRRPAPGHTVIPLLDGTVGVDRVETKPMGVPYDLNYDVEIHARQRQGMQNAANAILQKVMRQIQPSFDVIVQDSEGDARPYTAFTGTISPLDNLPGVKDRRIGFTMPVRIVGELDINDPSVSKTVQGRLEVRTRVLS
jgi:hypothetical protein